MGGKIASKLSHIFTGSKRLFFELFFYFLYEFEYLIIILFLNQYLFIKIFSKSFEPHMTYDK